MEMGMGQANMMMGNPMVGAMEMNQGAAMMGMGNA
jgi:hypothetical protein